MLAIASSSRQTRSNRRPLTTIDVEALTFASSSSSNFPSPISLPSKRGPSTLSAPSSPGTHKTRKVSRAEKDGTETIRKTRIIRGKGKAREEDEQDVNMDIESIDVGVTPKIRNILDRDDLGTGKSPARRLFGGLSQEQGSPISGISGAISPQPLNNIEIDIQDTPSLDSSTSLETDCGFVIYQCTSEEFAIIDRYTISRSSSSSPSEQSLSEIDQNLDNQENIAPIPSISLPPSPISKSRSNRSTTSKYSSTTIADDEIISNYLNVNGYSPSNSGSGTRRRERSKLINELLIRGEPMIEKEKADEKMDIDELVAEGEDFTPGRKRVVSNGREKLRREVNMV